jgi:hypothetical protein
MIRMVRVDGDRIRRVWVMTLRVSGPLAPCVGCLVYQISAAAAPVILQATVMVGFPELVRMGLGTGAGCYHTWSHTRLRRKGSWTRPRLPRRIV